MYKICGCTSHLEKCPFMWPLLESIILHKINWKNIWRGFYQVCFQLIYYILLIFTWHLDTSFKSGHCGQLTNETTSWLFQLAGHWKRSKQNQNCFIFFFLTEENLLSFFLLGWKSSSSTSSVISPLFDFPGVGSKIVQHKVHQKKID